MKAASIVEIAALTAASKARMHEMERESESRMASRNTTRNPLQYPGISASNTSEDFNTGEESINKPSSDEVLEIQSKISIKNTPEDTNTGGEIINKTSFDGGEILHMCHGIEEIPATRQARSRGTAAQSRKNDTGMEAMEARSRERNAEPMARMAQPREMKAKTTPEDSNTGEEAINKTSDHGGDPNNDAAQPSP